MNKSRILTLAILVLVAAACGTEPPLAQPIDLTGSWQLTSGSHGEATLEPIATHPVTIEFTAEHVGGTAACNSYGGTFDASTGAITISELAITEMACDPPETMELERAYIEALLAVSEATIEGTTLTLSGPEATLEFEALPPVPTADLLGTVWVLDGLVSGDSVSSVAGDRATLEVFSDGSLLGSTGCRTLTGTYVESAGSIETPTLAADGECPDDLFDQDSQVISVLEGPFQAEVDGQSLTLTRSGGEGLTYRSDH
ncbi:MAG TPA: META domain-containing protein [Acidimicrobiia bacterium]|nr:META domain-containing protein [Acidimicrobiia bacterium]